MPHQPPSDQRRQALRDEYIARINRVIDYIEANPDQYENAWDTVMGGWLPESGYQPDDRVCYEIYHNNPKEHPQGIHIVDICVPVKPL